MNLPNKLTISRFVLTVAFLAVMFSRMPCHETIALVLFCAGSISDFLDGQIARRQILLEAFFFVEIDQLHKVHQGANVRFEDLVADR